MDHLKLTHWICSYKLFQRLISSRCISCIRVLWIPLTTAYNHRFDPAFRWDSGSADMSEDWRLTISVQHGDRQRGLDLLQLWPVHVQTSLFCEQFNVGRFPQCLDAKPMDRNWLIRRYHQRAQTGGNEPLCVYLCRWKHIELVWPRRGLVGRPAAAPRTTLAESRRWMWH